MKERYEKVGWLYKGESINLPGKNQDSNSLGNFYGRAKSGATELYEKTTSALSSVADGAKGLWNKMTGGSLQGVYNSAEIEAGMDKVLASKAAYDPGVET